MGKIDVKKLKNRLTHKDHEKIMMALGIPMFSKSNDAWTYWTGEKNRDPYQGSPKLIYYLDSQIYVSYTSSCSMDIIGLAQKRLALLNEPSSFLDAVGFILRATGLDEADVSRISKSKYSYNWEDELGKFLRVRRGETTLPTYSKDILSAFDGVYPQQWIDEGISIDTLAKYRIGHYERTNATTIPCFDKVGELVGIRVRNWQPEDVEYGRKYMPLMLLDPNKIYKFPTNDVFYGINYNSHNVEATGQVILVEGEKSVLKADTWFGKDSNVLALYGSNIGHKRRNQLIRMGVKNVVLALDSDFHEADVSDKKYLEFEQKITRLGGLFKGYCNVDVVYNNIGLDGYQCSPFDFDYDTWAKLYDNRESLF